MVGGDATAHSMSFSGAVTGTVNSWALHAASVGAHGGRLVRRIGYTTEMFMPHPRERRGPGGFATLAAYWSSTQQGGGEHSVWIFQMGNTIHASPPTPAWSARGWPVRCIQ